MTLGFGALTLGAILILQGFTNRSLADVLLGRPGPGQPADIVSTDSTAPATTGGAGKSGSSEAPNGKHPSGVVDYNGVQVAAWIAAYFPQLKKCGWDGGIKSGYRDPAYSEKLCYAMCGAPSCPGKCAGKSSNHSGRVFPAGAIDVTNPASMEAALAKCKNVPLKNDLPADTVHYSFTGH